MRADFDPASISYDNEFTNTKVGKLQRDRVWNYLLPILTTDNSLKILEINCGTGEDAIHMASKGHQVTATDISEGMLKVASEKAKKNHLAEKVNIKQCSIQQLHQLKETQFDLIFSNFGGLNCISEKDFQQFVANCTQLLKSNGKVVLVIMPNFTLIESIYFILKFKFSRAFVRGSKTAVPVNVNGIDVNTWYFSPGKVKNMFATKGFKIRTIKPIGIFLPPSYLDPFFAKRQAFLNFLNTLEKLFGDISWLSNMSDHYLIALEKK